MKVSQKETTVFEFSTADCLAPDDNRPVRDEDLGELLESMRQHGQIVPGKVSIHPDVPGKKLCVAGNRRRRCCEILGIAFRAELIDRVLNRAEVIQIRVGENVHRKNPSPFELCSDASDYMAECQLATWAEVGQALSLSPSTLSRITSVRRIPQQLRPLAERVVPSVCWMIAAAPSVQAMEKALEFATTPGSDGKLPTRDQVGRFLGQFKAKQSRGPKPKVLKGRVDGRKVEIGLKSDETTESLIQFLNALTGKVSKYKDVPIGNLGFLFDA